MINVRRSFAKKLDTLGAVFDNLTVVILTDSDPMTKTQSKYRNSKTEKCPSKT